MEKITFVLLVEVIAFANALHTYCDRCHLQYIPYQMIYKRALLLYSSKRRILENLTNFLIDPSASKTILPPGLRNRFDPNEHPTFPKSVAQEAIKELIEQEDLIKRFYIPKKEE
ncbi:MAG: hypothetical protein GXO61_02130 [Epsilonproteobacteria bacterium]|nr:hypothetical protein [Campylobacterota bacterium]